MKGKRCKDLEIKIKDVPNYEDIYLVVGSNDCSSQNSTEQISDDCTLLVHFRYRNSSYEDELLKSDKLHISEKGVNRLITNMGLKEKSKICYAWR